MPNIDNLPRWFLTLIASVALTLTCVFGGILIKKSYADIAQNTADIQNTKVVAYQAKRVAEEAQLQYADLRGAVQEIKNSNETFRGSTARIKRKWQKQ